MEENKRGITESLKIDQEHAGNVQRCFLRLECAESKLQGPPIAQLKWTGWNAKISWMFPAK